MRPKQLESTPSDDLFRARLSNQLDRKSAGARGDATNAMLCGAEYNLRLILNYLSRLLRALILMLTSSEPLPLSVRATTQKRILQGRLS